MSMVASEAGGAEVVLPMLGPFELKIAIYGQKRPSIGSTRRKAAKVGSGQ